VCKSDPTLGPIARFSLSLSRGTDPFPPSVSVDRHVGNDSRREPGVTPRRVYFCGTRFSDSIAVLSRLVIETSLCLDVNGGVRHRLAPVDQVPPLRPSTRFAPSGRTSDCSDVAATALDPFHCDRCILSLSVLRGLSGFSISRNFLNRCYVIDISSPYFVRPKRISRIGG